MERKTSLPINAFRHEIIETVINNPVTVVIAEAGAGKSTHLPSMLSEVLPINKICVTEPRRLAASSVAQYVSGSQYNEEVGNTVGYRVRFDQNIFTGTRIEYVTDGVLLQEFRRDKLLSKYGLLVIDEAHERGVNVDVILGLVKEVLKERDDLRVVITSATVDARIFCDYFGDAPVIHVPGRTYSVDIVYQDDDQGYVPFDYGIKEYVSRALCETSGDVLIFLPDLEYIRDVRGILESEKISNTVILELFGSQEPSQQQLVYRQYPGKTKIILATNIAETSLTIDGVTAVIDSGLIKQSDIDRFTGVATLQVVEHSQAGCDQRAGRAGRTQSGVCYRMFTRKQYLEREKYTKPAIQRTSLENFILLMISLGLQVRDFDFLSQPGFDQIERAIKVLKSISAIDEDEHMTDLGKRIMKFSLDVRLAKLIIEAEKFGCIAEAVTVAAFLSVQSVLMRPRDREYEADNAHFAFNAPSDPQRMVKIWQAYKSSGHSYRWCKKNFINPKRMQEIGEIRGQIFCVNKRLGINYSKSESDCTDCIDKAFTATFLDSLAISGGRGFYNGLVDIGHYKVFPGSVLFSNSGSIICATQIVNTKQVYARICVNVKVEWLLEVAPHLVTQTKPKLLSYDSDEGMYVAETEIRIGDQVLQTVKVNCNLDEAREIEKFWLQQPNHFVTSLRDSKSMLGQETDDGYAVYAGSFQWRAYSVIGYLEDRLLGLRERFVPVSIYPDLQVDSDDVNVESERVIPPSDEKLAELRAHFGQK